MLKGRGEIDELLSSTHGGWRFETNSVYFYYTNGVYTHMPDSRASLLPNSQLQTNAFFDVTSAYFGAADAALLGAGGSAYAQAHRNRILSDAIPALTLPLGANPVSQAGIVAQNSDMQSSFENGWPSGRQASQLGAVSAGEWHKSNLYRLCVITSLSIFYNEVMNETRVVGRLR